MSQKPEIQTDAVDKETLAEYAASASTCNGWSFWYVENVNENAVVKDVFVEGEDAHCVVYDPDKDCIIDPTLGQFSGLPAFGAWDGEEHPYAAEWEEVKEWTDRDEFESHYGSMDVSPFIV